MSLKRLRQYSDEPSSGDEMRAAAVSLYRSTDHVATALRGAALVESSLAACILARLWTKHSDANEELLGNDGPLSTFSRKIRMGEAMRVFGPTTRKNLDLIRSIRNAFAHTDRALSFNDPPVSEVAKELTLVVWPQRKPRMPYDYDPNDMRSRFALCCGGLYMVQRAIARQTMTEERSLGDETWIVFNWWEFKYPAPLP